MIRISLKNNSAMGSSLRLFNSWDCVYGTVIGPAIKAQPALALALPVFVLVNCAVQLALAAPVSTNSRVEVPGGLGFPEVSTSAMWVFNKSVLFDGTGTVLPRTSERTVLQTVTQFDCTRMADSGQGGGEPLGSGGEGQTPDACGSTSLLVTVTSKPPVPLRPMISMPRPFGVCRIVLPSSSIVASELPLMLTLMPLPISEPELTVPLPIVLPEIVPVKLPPLSVAAKMAMA